MPIDFNDRARSSRRSFLGASGSFAAGFIAAPYIIHGAAAQTPTVVTRRPAHELTDSDPEVKTLRKAVRRLKDLPPHHPAHWSQMSRYHAQLCGPGALPDPNAEIHSTWWFLPWHRAYLSVVEHLLQWAAEDDSLALPYWDWVRSPKIPAIYDGDPATNPLAHAPRNVGADPRLLWWEQLTPADEPRVVGEHTFEEFGGGNIVDDQGNIAFRGGSLDGGLHGAGHVYIGGDMQSFTTAGNDPLFYAHHANVDRMWEVWRNAACLGLPRSDPTHADWGKRRFAFQDRSGGALIVRSPDVVNTQAVRFERFSVSGGSELIHPYRYERDALETMPECPAVPEVVAARSLRATSSNASEVPLAPAQARALVLQREAPLTLRTSGREARALAEQPSAPATASSRTIVTIRGVGLPDKPAQYTVSVRTPGKDEVVAARRIYIPSMSREQRQRATTEYSFDVTEALKSLGVSADDAEFVVRFQPEGDETSVPIGNAVLKVQP